MHTCCEPEGCCRDVRMHMPLLRPKPPSVDAMRIDTDKLKQRWLEANDYGKETLFDDAMGVIRETDGLLDAARQGESTANRLLEHHRARADQWEREFAGATIDMADEMALRRALLEAFTTYLNTHCEPGCEDRRRGCLCGRKTKARDAITKALVE